jgi:hypothetical protein
MFNGGPYFHSHYAHMRHQEMIQAAEIHRLLSQAIPEQENACIRQYRLHQKALIKLGEQLVNWGTTLQERYIRENGTPSLAINPEDGAYGK